MVDLRQFGVPALDVTDEARERDGERLAMPYAAMVIFAVSLGLWGTIGLSLRLVIG